MILKIKDFTVMHRLLSARRPIDPDSPDSNSNLSEEPEDRLSNPRLESRETGTSRKRGRPKVDRHEKLVCDVCTRTYTRKNKSQHERSKFHQSHAKLNKSLLDLLKGKTPAKEQCTWELPEETEPEEEADCDAEDN